MFGDRVAYDPAAVNADPLNGQTHFTQYAIDEYRKYLEGVIAERKLSVTIEEAMKRATLTSFATWLVGHLDKVRVVETSYSTGNVGLRLTDGAAITLCPPAVEEVRGTMQESHAVGITDGSIKSGDLPKAGTTLRI